MIPQAIKEEISSLSKPGASFKPHKYIALLVAIKIYKNDKEKTRRIYFNDEFKNKFFEYFSKYSSEDDRNRPYTPFFHLRSTSFWHLIALPGKANELLSLTSIGGPSQLSEIVSYAELDSNFCKLIDEDIDCKYIEKLIIDLLNEGRKYNIQNSKPLNQAKQDIFERLSFPKENLNLSNRFISYLNSMNCNDAASENALAESQACDPLFSFIHIEHPMVDIVRNFLTQQRKTHVVLTGHAGDGKSTIALDIFKQLNKLPSDRALTVPLKPRENITLSHDKTISIIKDLSEWSDDEKQKLLTEILEGNNNFLLVSNTGTLLNLFSNYGYETLKFSKAETEPLLLEAIDSEKPFNLEYGGNQFSVINLALQDNLFIAKKIFMRMLESGSWTECESKLCHHQCPIYRNIYLINRYKTQITDRIFMAYRRMYEYGTRLTLRQLTAHLTYILTAGLDCKDIFKFSSRPDKPLMSEFMFYNRFFGDNGKSLDRSALQLKAIQKIRQQGFGELPCPTWERKLWLLTSAQSFKIGISFIEEEFDLVRNYGSGEWNIEDKGLSSDQARDQVRRMLYFLYDFPSQDDSFIHHFLGSPAIMKWWNWQKDNAVLSLAENGNYKQRIFQVLQEQFAGLRLPENTPNDRMLYITLSQHNHEVRQSAQVVLAQIDFESEFSLVLFEQINSLGDKRRDIYLKGNGRLQAISIPLTLPFLDYVLMRQRGEAGEVLRAAYAARLEQLKSQLLKLGNRKNNDDVLLVRLGTNNTFKRQIYCVRNNRLEVA